MGGGYDHGRENVNELSSERLLTGDRRALARALTLIESTRPDHRRAAAALLAELRPKTGAALRIGLSGPPGVGKSTFIEAFGQLITASGARVGVLAVDPSSDRSGGSVLGDKTRMDRLARDPNAFIRPSPAGATLGGVARRTREAAELMDAAGFGVVLIETVGVGQSETAVADMTDVFVLLVAPAGGDELQGVKRGVMERADFVLVNKADGALEPVARATAADYASALRLLRRRSDDPEDVPAAMVASARTGAGYRERVAADPSARRLASSRGVARSTPSRPSCALDATGDRAGPARRLRRRSRRRRVASCARSAHGLWRAWSGRGGGAGVGDVFVAAARRRRVIAPARSRQWRTFRRLDANAPAARRRRLVC